MKSVKKILYTMPLIVGITMTINIPAYAGTWKQNMSGWWYQNDDGTYPKAIWQWIDGNGDGVAESYCFNSDGYLYVNTITPDGYYVNENGAWVINEVVQTQIQDQIAAGISEDEAISMVIEYVKKTSDSRSNLVISLDSVDNQFYHIHVYENVKLDDGDEHTATWGWIDVDRITGDMFDAIMFEPIYMPK